MRLAACVSIALGVLGCSGDDGSDGGDPPASGDPMPVLPQPSGACPDFGAASQEIMGLNTRIVAGSPGASKGPLLFTFHGTTGTGDQALVMIPRSVQDDIVAQGGIIVAPSSNGQVREGQDVTVFLNVWYDEAELKFTDHVAACAVQNHNIDPRRIYVTGCSAGGLMAGMMALKRASYVAAAAPNSGGTVLEVPPQASDYMPAVMTMHGGGGDTVVVNFGEMSQRLENILLPAGSFVVECNHGIGHCLAPAELHERAWDFMKAHPFGTGPSPYAAGLPGDFPSYCAIQ